MGGGLAEARKKGGGGGAGRSLGGAGARAETAEPERGGDWAELGRDLWRRLEGAGAGTGPRGRVWGGPGRGLRGRVWAGRGGASSDPLTRGGGFQPRRPRRAFAAGSPRGAWTVALSDRGVGELPRVSPGRSGGTVC